MCPDLVWSHFLAYDGTVRRTDITTCQSDFIVSLPAVSEDRDHWLQYATVDPSGDLVSVGLDSFRMCTRRPAPVIMVCTSLSCIVLGCTSRRIFRALLPSVGTAVVSDVSFVRWSFKIYERLDRRRPLLRCSGEGGVVVSDVPREKNKHSLDSPFREAHLLHRRAG